VLLGLKLTIVLSDNRGFGCIQQAANGDRRRNRQQYDQGCASRRCAHIDFFAHAASLGDKRRRLRPSPISKQHSVQKKKKKKRRGRTPHHGSWSSATDR